MGKPFLVIHGGSGRAEGNGIPFESYDRVLREIVESGYEYVRTHTAAETILHVMFLMEDQDIFNSGTGSKLQRDGKVRMSAAFMDGSAMKFSAVMNVEDVQHPIDLAYHLNGERHTVLAGPPATAYARARDFQVYDPVTPYRLQEHAERSQGETGTCGAVVVDAAGRIAVGTSTGGIGYEVPGRVGDSPTVAGTYANRLCGVSCTGIGEHIVNEAVAAAIVTRVNDGILLQDAVGRSVQAGNARHCRYGLIAAHVNGEIEVGQTEGIALLYAKRDEGGCASFLADLR